METDVQAEFTLTAATAERFASILERRRVGIGLTLQQVADRLGMCVGSVHNLMTGKHTYPVEVLDRVAQALDWSLLELVFAVSLPKPEDSPSTQRIRAIMSKATAEARSRRASRQASGS